jgi:hypothetical protein
MVDCTLDSDVDFDNLHLPVLEEFCLILQGDSSAASLSTFFDHISMPALRALDITWLDRRPTLWHDCHLFASFLRRISSTLTTLNLAYLPVSETELVDVLAPLSEVTHLHLRFSFSDHEHDPVSDRLFTSLTLPGPLTEDIDGSQGALLPSLVSLDLQCNGSKFSNSALLGMVKSRWKRGGDRFGHFGLLFMRPVLREVEKQVQLMHEEGLDISVQTLFVM